MLLFTDCRFPNEIKSIKSAGGYIVRVKRGEEPEWYDAALSYNKGEWSNMTWALSRG